MEAEEKPAEPGAPAGDSRGSLARRLHSLAGVLPLGLFLLLHLGTNARALWGAERFEQAMSAVQRARWLPAVELLLLALPLAFHAGYGLWLARERGVLGEEPKLREWLRLLQRLTGVGALCFLGAHLWHFRLARLLGRARPEDYTAMLLELLNRPGAYAGYVLGVSAVVFHFAHGLWLAGGRWGLWRAEAAQRRAGYGMALFGLLVWVLGMDVLAHYAVQCGGFLGLPRQDLLRLCATGW